MAIDHARWQRLSPLLDRALDLAAEERDRWLALMRGDEPQLADELDALLDEAQAASDERFLEVSPDELQHATGKGS